MSTSLQRFSEKNRNFFEKTLAMKPQLSYNDKACAHCGIFLCAGTAMMREVAAGGPGGPQGGGISAE
jgi:hypothetical protein